MSNALTTSIFDPETPITGKPGRKLHAQYRAAKTEVSARVLDFMSINLLMRNIKKITYSKMLPWDDYNRKIKNYKLSSFRSWF